MLVVINNETTYDWSIGMPVPTLDYIGDVVVIVDPSKTNMAVMVGTPDKYILGMVEFSGNNRRKGPAMNTSQYCQEFRMFLQQYLQKCHIYIAAVEQAVGYEGMEHYQSQMVLTEVRANLLSFFKDNYGIQAIELNNWAWKAGALPEGFRGKSQKGSKLWFETYMPDAPLAHFFEADMTDCYFMYVYIVDNKCAGYTVMCNQKEPASGRYTYFFTPVSKVFPNQKSVVYNPRFTLEDNLNYYTNRLVVQFELDIPVNLLTLDDIYGRCSGFTFDDLSAVEVKAVVRRF